MKMSIGLLGVVAASAAWAAPTRVGPAVAVTASQVHCPSGTTLSGGKDSPLEAFVCVRTSADGNREFDGPYVALYPSGLKLAEGQYLRGFRSGLWKYFDKAGVEYSKIEFRRGDYHGLRTENYPSGQKKFEETWVEGKRQGLQRYWDDKGALTELVYKDDRPVVAAK